MCFNQKTQEGRERSLTQRKGGAQGTEEGMCPKQISPTSLLPKASGRKIINLTRKKGVNI